MHNYIIYNVMLKITYKTKMRCANVRQKMKKSKN